jgi:hypothetical protein
MQDSSGRIVARGNTAYLNFEKLEHDPGEAGVGIQWCPLEQREVRIDGSGIECVDGAVDVEAKILAVNTSLPRDG